MTSGQRDFQEGFWPESAQEKNSSSHLPNDELWEGLVATEGTQPSCPWRRHWESLKLSGVSPNPVYVWREIPVRINRSKYEMKNQVKIINPTYKWLQKMYIPSVPYL